MRAFACVMRFKELVVVFLVTVVVCTEGLPARSNMIVHQDELQTDSPPRRDEKTNNNLLNSADGLNSAKSYKNMPAPVVDDDLLEFLIRVADNPSEWNKIRRVLSMLRRDENGTPTMDTMTATPTTTRTVATVGLTSPKPSPVTVASAWPSSDWILETLKNIKVAARTRETAGGGVMDNNQGELGAPFDYSDDDEDDGDDEDAGDEIEVIEEPPTTLQPPLSRAVAGHMSRYQFKRIDGHPADDCVNGTYVAVVESDRPPRGVIYDPAKQKNFKTTK